MKNGFVKFIIAILTFFVLLFVCDKIVVRVEDKLYSTKDNKLNYAAYNQDNAELVILGSSRANHHYVPSILTDSLGMSCVNLGMDGQGILHNYAVFHMLLQNNTPRVIIYEFGGYDWEDKGVAAYATNEHLAPMYGKYDTVDTLIDGVGQIYSRTLSLLNTYKYNGRIHNIFVNTNHIAKHNGYSPLYGELKVAELSSDKENAKAELPVHLDKIQYLKKMIKECQNRGVLLVFAISPTMRNNRENTSAEVLDEICGNDVLVLDYREEFNDSKWFKDITHMNDVGARVYTQQIACELKRIMSECEF